MPTPREGGAGAGEPMDYSIANSSADAKPEYQDAPDRMLDGRPNPEHFVVRIRNLNLLNEWTLRHKGEPLKGYKQQLEGIIAEARLMGIKAKEVVEGGTVEDKATEVTIDLLDDPTVNRLLESEDEVLTVMEKRMTEAVMHCEDEILKKTGLIKEQAEAYRRRAAKGKVWLNRLRRVKRLRELARERVPGGFARMNGAAVEASWPLRWLVYVFRSDIAAGTREVDNILDMPRHVAHWAVDYWIAKEGATFYIGGNRDEANAQPTIFWNKPQNGWKRKSFECKGIVIVGPPRHMKTTFGFGAITLDMYLNNRVQCLTLHAIEQHGVKNYQYIADTFDRDNSRGRRARSLFPKVDIDRKNDRVLRLKLPERTKDPQCRAVGVLAATAGSNNDRQWWDDPVDPKMADNDGERERITNQLLDVHFRRLQGDDAFLLITATIWHHDDPVARIKKMAGQGKFPFAVSICRVGGPKGMFNGSSYVAGSRPFEPLWVEKYPASYLKTQFAAAGSFRYACQFECNATPDEQRLIRRLALYLADFGECERPKDCRTSGGQDCGKCHGCLYRQHKEFLRTAEFHLSLDPSATSRQNRTKKTDRSAIVYAAKGDLVLRSVTKMGTTGWVTNEDRIPRIRVIDAEAFYAGPTEGVEYVYTYGLTHRLDKVHVEVATFSSAIVEMFRNQLKLTASQIIGHQPKNVSKETRLRAVSTMLDDSQRDFGMSGPVCEFPGTLDQNGNIICHPKFKWLHDQIVGFGMSNEDHAVDAITQLLKSVMPDMSIGEGAVSAAIRREMVIESQADMIRARMMDEYDRTRDDAEPRDAVEEEVLFIKKGCMC